MKIERTKWCSDHQPPGRMTGNGATCESEGVPRLAQSSRRGAAYGEQHGPCPYRVRASVIDPIRRTRPGTTPTRVLTERNPAITPYSSSLHTLGDTIVVTHLALPPFAAVPHA